MFHSPWRVGVVQYLAAVLAAAQVGPALRRPDDKLVGAHVDNPLQPLVLASIASMFEYWLKQQSVMIRIPGFRPFHTGASYPFEDVYQSVFDCCSTQPCNLWLPIEICAMT